MTKNSVFSYLQLRTSVPLRWYPSPWEPWHLQLLPGLHQALWLLSSGLLQQKRRHPLAEETVTVAAATVSLGSRHLRLSSPIPNGTMLRTQMTKSFQGQTGLQVQITANGPTSLALESALALEAPEAPHQRGRKGNLGHKEASEPTPPKSK